MRKIIEFIVNLLLRVRASLSPKKVKEIPLKEYKDYISKEYDINLFKEINYYRQSKGLAFVESAPENVINIVGEHADWLADVVFSKEDLKIFGHWNNYNRFEQIKLRTSNKAKCGEVVAYGYAHPKSVVYAWDSSPGHKEVLNGNFNYVAVASEGKCVVAVFYKL